MTQNSSKEDLELIVILKKRFETNMHRHKNVTWDTILEKISKSSTALNTLRKMEETSGEPDVVTFDMDSSDIIYCDCSKESPKDRRSLCYDTEALLSRKKFPPVDSAINQAKEFGLTLLNEKMYRELQSIEVFDLKTSSWVLTPKDIRSKGGAIFCDRRYGNIFTYHNGADSYYSSRGYRGYFIL